MCAEWNDFDVATIKPIVLVLIDKGTSLVKVEVMFRRLRFPRPWPKLRRKSPRKVTGVD